MWTNIKKDDSYSKVMQTEGTTPVDEDSNYVMELPKWADEKKIKMGQTFFLLNLNAMVHALSIGLVAVTSTSTILKIILFTKQSSTPASAYRRYQANALHTQAWYKYQIEPGTIAWKSLETVRKMHFVINKRVSKLDVGIISQKDMAVTLFTLMGIHLLVPDKAGIVGSIEQFEAFNHFWRVIGYLLGMQDRFNCCTDSLTGTLNRLEAIREDMIGPTLQIPSQEYERYTKIAMEGMWHFNPFDNHYDATTFGMKRILKIPGCYYFESETKGDDETNQNIYSTLSFYAKFRVLLDIIIYEYLSQIFIFRWIFNIIRMSTTILEFYPFLAIRSYGKKVAYVEIMKSKTRT